MPMVVTNYLAQFCHLVRDRVIPKSEVHRLIDKYSLSQDLLEVFERILSSAREAAESISKDEKSARASSWILIAGFSHLDEDIKMAIACANDLGNDDMESQILMSLVKTLVNAGKIKQAWQIAFKIRKDYWRTEAILAIASKTRLSEDFARARGSAKYIMDDSKHNDVLDEIVRVEKGESVPWLSDEEGNHQNEQKLFPADSEEVHLATFDYNVMIIAQFEGEK